MKKIFLFAIAIVSIVFTSCNKPEEAKLVSQLDSLQVKDGLDRECMIKCFFGTGLDGWITADRASLFFNGSILEAKRECKHEGSFVPKDISCYDVDTITTENGLKIYHCSVFVKFYASNAFGVQDLLYDSFDNFFFEEECEDCDYRINDIFYPIGDRIVYHVDKESTFNEYVKYNMHTEDDKLDSFELDGVKYVIYKFA